MGNKKKISSAFFVTILVFSIFATLPFAAASPDEVIYVPDDYATIQGAVNAVFPGDTIIVRDGTYTENVNVNNRLTIKSENGSDKTIVQAENSNDHVFEVTTDYVNISGFTIKESYRAGIYLYYADYCNISNNNCSSNFDGIYLTNSNNNVISHNIILNNIFYISGVHLFSSNNNTIVKNNISNNDQGIYLSSSNNNLIYLNNFIDNTNSVYSSGSTNIWNSTSPITYTYNGNQYTNNLGNYWDDHTGTDADGDGVRDTTYNIDGDEDKCPLVQPFENYIIEEQNEIKFRGTVTGKNPPVIGAAWWNVTVVEVISGPQPCNDNITVRWICYPPYGYTDPNITEGDKVEVYGKYYQDQDECYVSLNGREDYYIKRWQEGDCGTILKYAISNGTYSLPQTVTASIKYKSNMGSPTKFKGVFLVRNQKTGKNYSSNKEQITAPYGEDRFGYGKGNSLQIRFEDKEEYIGVYDAKLELRNYNTDELCEETEWKENQFKIESSEVPGWSEDIRITNDSAYSINPRIAVDSNNNVHIVWEDNRDGNYWIYYTKLDNQGNTLIDDKKIVSLPFISSNELFTYDTPSIAMDSNDNIHLAFIEYVDSAIYEVFYIKLDNNGNVLSSLKRGDNNLALKRSPDIAVDSDNNVHIVWEDYTDYPTEVYYSKLDSSGNILINSERLTYDTKASGFPKIAVDSSNNIHVVSGGALDYYFPDIAIDSNDNRHNVWCSEGNPQWMMDPGIYYKKLDKNGNIVVYTKLIIDSDNATRPVIAIDSHNHIHMIWIEGQIWYTKLDNTGNKLINDTQLTFDPASPWKPDIAIDSDDKVHITWQDDRDGNWEIYYKSNAMGPKITKDWPMFHHDQRHTGYSASTAPNNNNIAWIFETEGKLTSSPAVADNKVFVGSDDGKIYCLDESTGKLIWDFQTGGPVRSSPAVVGGKIFVGSRDNKTYCLNGTNGNLIWSNETGDWVDSSPTVVNGRVFIGSKDHNIYCLDENTGWQIWNHSTLGQVYSSPAVADGVIYIGDNYGKIYALRENDGELIWDYKTRGSIESSPAVVDGKVYVGSFSLDYFYCFDVDGNLLWVSDDIGSTVTSSPAVANGKVFVGSRDNKIYCLNGTNGDLIWSNETADCVDSSPAIADGKVFVGSYDNKLYALDEDTGELVWYYETGDDVWSSPAVANGKVFVGSNDGKIYAFGEAVGPKIIEVDDDFVDDPPNHKWDTIQEGINDANDGDTVIVYNGSYYENVVVNKSLILKGIGMPVIDVSGSGNCINVTTDNVEIYGFRIKNGIYGVYLESSDKSTIDTNIISNNFDGIYLHDSNNNIITNNILSNNLVYISGIHLSSSNNNTIVTNNISNNDHGIDLFASNNNLIYHNNFIDNTQNAYDNTGTNYWDNGYPSGGNYWGDYKEKYPDAKEIDESGIWDTPYEIPGDAGANDNYPLMEPWGEEPLPDLVFEEITFSDTSPRWDDKINITTKIKNISKGTIDRTFTVRFDIKSPYLGENPYAIEKSIDWTSQAVGDTVTLKVPFTPEYAGTYKINVTVDSKKDITEGNETNNTKNVELNVNTWKNQALIGKTTIVVLFVDFNDNAPETIDSNRIKNRWQDTSNAWNNIILENSKKYNLNPEPNFEIVTIGKNEQIIDKLDDSPNTKIIEGLSESEFIKLIDGKKGDEFADLAVNKLGLYNRHYLVNYIKKSRNPAPDHVLLAFFIDSSEKVPFALIHWRDKKENVVNTGGNIMFFPNYLHKDLPPLDDMSPIITHETLHCFGAIDKSLLVGDDIMGGMTLWINPNIKSATDVEIGWDLTKGLVGGRLVNWEDGSIICGGEIFGLLSTTTVTASTPTPYVTYAAQSWNSWCGYYIQYKLALPAGHYFLRASRYGYVPAFEFIEEDIKNPPSINLRHNREYAKSRNIPMKKLSPNSLQFFLKCPIDMIITDPNGNTIMKDNIEIPNCFYDEFADGGDLVTILGREMGNYQIAVVPETSAKSNDTFSLEVLCGNQSIIIAENVSISDIPHKPYIIESAETGILDKTPPVITIYSPVNGTIYPAGSVNLNYSVSEPTVWAGYSLDRAENVTLSGNTTLTCLREGQHTVTVYANDTSGNMGHSTVWFAVGESTIFDTGPGTYPSIFGTHKGAITPSQNITVHKLYTYPCEGTGGHTEYVRIYGNGIDKSASWNGYSGDWQYIYFDNLFVLEEGKTYNYTIITGSYPQIIHEHEYDKATGGTITCTKFIDANGCTYTDWIPAIKLE